MSAREGARTALVVGAGRRFGAEVAERLRRDGFRVETTDVVGGEPVSLGGAHLDAVVVNAMRPVAGASFLALEDVDFVQALGGFLDVADVLRAALPRLREGGALVLLVSRGHLGGWGNAAEMAMDGGLVALMRSIALEDAPRGVRANVVASDFTPGDFGADKRVRPDHAERVAAAVAFFTGEDSAAVSGELLLTNSGRSLQRREGRDRRAELAALPSPPPIASDR